MVTAPLKWVGRHHLLDGSVPKSEVLVRVLARHARSLR
jgi:hypothetical protein